MSDKKASWKTPFLTMKFVAIMLIGILLIGIYTFTGSKSKLLPQNTSNPRISIYEDNSLAQFNHFSLEASDYTLLSVWATWCPTCKPELSALNQLSQSWSDKKINFSSVNVDPHQNLTKVQNLWSDLSLDIKLITNVNPQFLKDFNIEVLPSYFLIKDNSLILLKIDGATDWNDPKIKNLILNKIHIN